MKHEARVEPLEGGRVRRVVPLVDGARISYAAALAHWRDDASFRASFFDSIVDAPYRALRFETPPVHTSSVAQPFEYVLLDSPFLDEPPDRSPFAEHFGDEDVVVFSNLGKDATLIVPAPRGNEAAYTHLAAFLRMGPEDQKHALWQTVARVTLDRLARDPVWLSTAGGGVAWLHVRLDDRPKYYGFAPYREADL